MTEKEIDLFADAEKSSEDITASLNEKMYQVVDLKNGTFQFKRYNGSKAEQRYTSLGYFKLAEKSYKESLHDSDISDRKIEGNKTIRRAKSDVITQLHNLLPLLESYYRFYSTTNEINEAELALADKYVQELNEKFKTAKITAELEAIIAIGRNLSHLTMKQSLTPEQQKLYADVDLYMKSVAFNVKRLLAI